MKWTCLGQFSCVFLNALGRKALKSFEFGSNSLLSPRKRRYSRLENCALYKGEQNSKSSAVTEIAITSIIPLKSALLRGSPSTQIPGHHILVTKSCQAYLLSTSLAALEWVLTVSHVHCDSHLPSLFWSSLLLAIRLDFQYTNPIQNPWKLPTVCSSELQRAEGRRSSSSIHTRAHVGGK